MTKEELFTLLNEDYNLRSSLQRKGLSVHKKLEEEISANENQYISEYVLPELKAKAESLLSGLQCEVCIGINKDINGTVSVDDELNADIGPWNPKEAEKPEEKSEEHSSRGARKKFKVIFNGREVPGDDGATILANTIRLIGFRRVASMGMMFANGRYNLVDRQKRTDKNQIWQRKIDDWYVYTNMQNPEKVRILREIAEKQNLNLVVEES